MAEFEDAEVARVFAAYPSKLRKRLLALRRMIFDVARREEVGKLQETLKWGEPAYVTAESGSGSTVRINRHKKQDGQYAIYFHCQTTLVDSFRTLFADVFNFEGNRCIVFHENDRVPVAALKHCIAMALTYHRDQGRKRSSVAGRRQGQNATRRSADRARNRALR
jgi:Domain of unknown function (DU1801)